MSKHAATTLEPGMESQPDKTPLPLPSRAEAPVRRRKKSRGGAAAVALAAAAALGATVPGLVGSASGKVSAKQSAEAQTTAAQQEDAQTETSIVDTDCNEVTVFNVDPSPETQAKLIACGALQKAKVALVPYDKITPEVAKELGLQAKQLSSAATNGLVRLQFEVVLPDQAAIEAFNQAVGKTGAVPQGKNNSGDKYPSSIAARLMPKKLAGFDAVVALTSNTSGKTDRGTKPGGLFVGKESSKKTDGNGKLLIDLYQVSTKRSEKLKLIRAGVNKAFANEPAPDAVKLAHEMAGHGLGLGHADSLKQSGVNRLDQLMASGKKKAKLDLERYVKASELEDRAVNQDIMSPYGSLRLAGKTAVSALDPVQQVMLKEFSNPAKTEAELLTLLTPGQQYELSAKTGRDHIVGITLDKPITLDSQTKNGHVELKDADGQKQYSHLFVQSWEPIGGKVGGVNLFLANDTTKDTLRLGSINDTSSSPREWTISANGQNFTITRSGDNWNLQLA